MKYLGSKRKYAKELLEIILKDRSEQLYIEPFCGGCNIIDKVIGKRVANDQHEYLIALLHDLTYKNFKPPNTISNEEYYEMKKHYTQYQKALIGFVGFCCSYGGMWWNGYARSRKTKRNYCAESKRNLLKQKPNLTGIKFTNENFLDINIPNGSIVYCDPPYQNTKSYKNVIDYIQFWDWIRSISKHNKVYISEYNAPDDFECIWSKKVYNSLMLNTGSKQGVEKLFKIK